MHENDSGMTLYYFTMNADGQSACYGECADAWPIFYAPNVTILSSLDAQDFGTVTRKDGTKQTTYHVDENGKALYWFTKDSLGQSACSGDCLKAWPAFSAESIVVPSALSAADFDTITQADGTSQTTYKGYPLYYWVKDTKRETSRARMSGRSGSSSIQPSSRRKCRTLRGCGGRRHYAACLG